MFSRLKKFSRVFRLKRFIWNYRSACRKEVRAPLREIDLLRHPYFDAIHCAYKHQVNDHEVDNLFKKADEILTLPSLSIAQKTHIPESGCANDYVSFVPYYWSDEDISPMKKASIPNKYLDGRPNPVLANFSDKPKLAQMCARVHILALAWLKTKNSDYLDYIYQQLDVWFLQQDTRMTPHMRYAQLVPWRGKKIGLGLIDARWFILLLDALAILQRENALRTNVKVSIMAWFQEFALWILSSRSGLFEVAHKNNRGSWIDALLAYICLALNRENSAGDIVNHALSKRPVEQFNVMMQQPMELRRYTYVSYSLYNLYPLYYLYHINRECNFTSSKGTSDKSRDLELVFKEFEKLTAKIEKHEKGKIEVINFTEKFSLNLYYPYSFSQLKYFPSISPFQN